MLFPNSAKQSIAKAFYDKEITILSIAKTIDEEGGVINTESIKGNIKGNVRFNNLGNLKTELGLLTDIDIAITCLPNEDITKDDILEYQNNKYVINSVIPFDSHLMIVGKIWQ